MGREDEDQIQDQHELDNGKWLYHARFSDEELDVIKQLTGFNFATILDKTEQEILKRYVGNSETHDSITTIANSLKIERGRVSHSLRVIGRKIRKHLGMEE